MNEAPFHFNHMIDMPTNSNFYRSLLRLAYRKGQGPRNGLSYIASRTTYMNFLAERKGQSVH